MQKTSQAITEVEKHISIYTQNHSKFLETERINF